MYAIVTYEGLFFAFDATSAIPAQLRFHSTGNWYFGVARHPFLQVLIQLLEREYCQRAQRATLVDLYLTRELPVT